eukprot:SAG22_NODE_3789_length_1530_cov_2.571628_1_plen_284_part_10
MSVCPDSHLNRGTTDQPTNQPTQAFLAQRDRTQQKEQRSWAELAESLRLLDEAHRAGLLGPAEWEARRALALKRWYKAPHCGEIAHLNRLGQADKGRPARPQTAPREHMLPPHWATGVAEALQFVSSRDVREGTPRAAAEWSHGLHSPRVEAAMRTRNKAGGRHPNATSFGFGTTCSTFRGGACPCPCCCHDCVLAIMGAARPWVARPPLCWPPLNYCRPCVHSTQPTTESAAIRPSNKPEDVFYTRVPHREADDVSGLVPAAPAGAGKSPHRSRRRRRRRQPR